MSKKKHRLEALNQQISKIQAEIEKEKQDSEAPLTRDQELTNCLEEIKLNLKEIGKKNNLNLFELFGLLEAYKIDLTESSKE